MHSHTHYCVHVCTHCKYGKIGDSHHIEYCPVTFGRHCMCTYYTHTMYAFEVVHIPSVDFLCVFLSSSSLPSHLHCRDVGRQCTKPSSLSAHLLPPPVPVRHLLWPSAPAAFQSVQPAILQSDTDCCLRIILETPNRQFQLFVHWYCHCSAQFN